MSANRTGGRSRFMALFKRRIMRRNIPTRLFSIGLYLLNLPRRIRQPERVRHILVFHNNFLGDTVFLSVVYRSLRSHFTNASITAVTNQAFQPILEADPNIDEVLIHPRSDPVVRTFGEYVKGLFGYRKRGFDAIIELQSDSFSVWLAFLYLWRARRVEIYLPALRDTLRTYKILLRGGVLRDFVPDHAVVWNLRLIERLGVDISDREVSLPVEPTWPAAVGEKFPEIAALEGKYFVVCPGASWEEKRWSVEKFASVAESVARDYGLTPVIAGGKGELELCGRLKGLMSIEAVNTVGKLDVREFIALTDGAQLLIGNDSGPVHVATGVDTPVVAVIGTSNIHMYRPAGKAVRICYREVTCGPCYAGMCYMPENVCLQPVTVEEVVAAARDLLGPSV